MEKVKFIICLLLLLFSFPAHLYGTEEYAEQTGRSCGACHVNPLGGEELTPEGRIFRDDLSASGRYRPLTTTQRLFRVIVFYIHMMTAIIWFGTILYVHIFLKPAYAAKGLPKAELRLGWGSIGVMAVTGTILTIAKVQSFDILFHTRFGILLSIKIVLFLLMVSAAALATLIIGPRFKKKKQLLVHQHKGELTADELTQFDGKEGRSAYIVYKGTIYNVSDSKLWQDGSHLKRHHAGLDLSGFLKQAPHGEDKVISMPRVGKLLESNAKIRKPERFFYFLAYFNLVLVFLIILIISLWRW